MHQRWMGVLIVVLALSLACVVFGQAAKPAGLDEGQKVEVREGDTWSPATIVKKEGRRFLIRYEGGTEEEWVAGDRVRAGGASTPAPASAAKPTAPKPAPAAPAIANWANGANVQVKWGGLWFDATIVNRRGEWYLIEYGRDKGREWVEHWRIRKAGSTDDEIGYAKPNPRWKAGDNPPREKAGEPPETPGGGRKELEKAKEEFSADPAFKEANTEAVNDLNLNVGGGALNIKPDPAPPAGNVRPIKFAGASREFFDTVKDLVISRNGKFAAAIHHDAPPGQEAKLRLERLDLSAGKSAGVFPLPEKMALLDLSPDGHLAALRNDEFGFGKNTRLEIWALDGTAIKKVLILFPYGKEHWGPDRDVSGAWLIDNATVLTTNPKGKLVLWDMSTGRAIYRAKTHDRFKPAFSGGGKQMAIEAEKSVVIVEPDSGKVLGSLSLEGQSQMNYAFSPSGKQLAAFGGQTIYGWDLSTGKLFREFSIAAGNGGFSMVADGYAMLDYGLLIDFERRIPLWQYQAGGRSTGAIGPGGVLWYTIKGGKEEHGPLTPLKVPTDDALALAKTLNADDLLLLKPGVHVAVAMNVDAPEADRQAILESFKAQLTQNKLVLDDAAPIRFIASNEPGKTTEVEYRPIGARPFAAPQKVSVTPMITKLTVEVDGKKAWEKTSVSGPGFMLMMKEGQTLEQAVAEAAKVNIPFLRDARLPVFLTKPHEPAWYGSSRLDK